MAQLNSSAYQVPVERPNKFITIYHKMTFHEPLTLNANKLFNGMFFI